MAIRLYCERCAMNEILKEMIIIPMNKNTIHAFCPLCGFATKPIGIGEDDYGKTV